MVNGEPLDEGNIQLDYRLAVCINKPDGDETSYYADGAEVFMDEHNVQWIKFFAKNGYHAGSEHMVRTEGLTIVRLS